eukprot:1199253-Amphidinium_carterae.1
MRCKQLFTTPLGVRERWKQDSESKTDNLIDSSQSNMARVQLTCRPQLLLYARTDNVKRGSKTVHIATIATEMITIATPTK